MNKERWVVCAAIMFSDGRIVCGPRHPHAMWLAANAIVVDNQPVPESMTNIERVRTDDYEQGFVDQFMDFMTREEAWVIAEKNGQIRREVSSPGILFSENLY